MCSNLEHARQLGAAGIVCGILREDNTVDRQRTSKLVKLAGSLAVTFHRAFDGTPDLVRALEDVIECGCDRVLTSGGKPCAGEAESTLAELVEQGRGRIRIAAGGGITVPIAASLLARTRLDLHTSLRRRLVPEADVGPHIDAAGEPSFALQVSDVRSLVAVMAKADT